MTQSLSRLEERLDSIENKLEELSFLVKRGDYSANAVIYNLKQTAFEVGCSRYTLARIYEHANLGEKGVLPPKRGSRYSKKDVALFREAYVNFKSHNYG